MFNNTRLQASLQIITILLLLIIGLPTFGETSKVENSNSPKRGLVQNIRDLKGRNVGVVAGGIVKDVAEKLQDGIEFFGLLCELKARNSWTGCRNSQPYCL